jgi:hypothetical protein
MKSYPSSLPIVRINNHRLRVAVERLHADFATSVPAEHFDFHRILTSAGVLVAALPLALNRSLASELVARKIEADEDRDALTTYGTEFIRAQSRHPNAETAVAAQRLVALIEKRNSGFTRLGYDENTSELDLFLRDLESSEATADLETLGLADWLASLKTSAATFKTRREEELAAADDETGPALYPTKKALARHFGLLFALAEFYANEGEQTFIDLLTRAGEVVADLKRYRDEPRQTDEAPATLS